MQIIFQDPFSSLNPRMSAGDIVGEPLRVHGIGKGRKERRERVAELFGRVGLRAGADRQLSAPVLRRAAPAHRHRPRAGARPKLIIGDEPVSALDVSIQAQVLNLLMDLQRELGSSYLFISHNLAVVEHISHRIAVMYLGRIVEYTDKKTLFTAAAASLHRGAAVGRAGARSGDQAQEDRAAGRRAEPGHGGLGLCDRGRRLGGLRSRKPADRGSERQGPAAGSRPDRQVDVDRHPAGFTKLLNHKTFNWNFEMEAEEGMANRRIPCPRGRTLGGSSSINGMLYVRGQPLDYDTWGQLGNRGWSYRRSCPTSRSRRTSSAAATTAAARAAR